MTLLDLLKRTIQVLAAPRHGLIHCHGRRAADTPEHPFCVREAAAAAVAVPAAGEAAAEAVVVLAAVDLPVTASPVRDP